MTILEFLNLVIPGPDDYVLLHNNYHIPVDNVSKITIDINRKIYNLDFVVSISDGINMGLFKEIELSPYDCDLKVSLIFNKSNFTLPCNITKVSYLGNKHVYLVSSVIDTQKVMLNNDIKIPSDKEIGKKDKSEKDYNFIDI